jgi:hypothetical protein
VQDDDSSAEGKRLEERDGQVYRVVTLPPKKRRPPKPRPIRRRRYTGTEFIPALSPDGLDVLHEQERAKLGNRVGLELRYWRALMIISLAAGEKNLRRLQDRMYGAGLTIREARRIMAAAIGCSVEDVKNIIERRKSFEFKIPRPPLAETFQQAKITKKLVRSVFDGKHGRRTHEQQEARLRIGRILAAYLVSGHSEHGLAKDLREWSGVPVSRDAVRRITRLNAQVHEE